MQETWSPTRLGKAVAQGKKKIELVPEAAEERYELTDAGKKLLHGLSNKESE